MLLKPRLLLGLKRPEQVGAERTAVLHIGGHTASSRSSSNASRRVRNA